MGRPLMNRADLLEELEMIEMERQRVIEQTNVVNTDGRLNLLNEGRLNLHEPGWFYVRPFFVAPPAAPSGGGGE